MKDEDTIYKNFDFFKGTLWPARFHRKFVNKINELREKAV